jgi:diguanylate cyclase (GGDEF)-like protein
MSFLSAIAVISLSLMFPVLLSLRKTGVPGIASFCAACLLTALAASVTLAASVVPAWFHTIAGGALIVTAGLLILRGFLQFLGRKPLGPWPIVVILTGVTAVLLVLSYAADSHSARIVTGNGVLSLTCVLIGATILRHWPREQAIAPYMLFCCVMVFLVAILHAFRVATVATGLDVMDGALPPPIWTTAFLAARLLIMPLFKQINDLYGHAGGDAALVHFTRIVKETLDGRGILGRLGGEEFGIALANTGRLDAAEIAETICTAVRTTPTRADKGTEIGLTVSIGIAMVDPGGSLADVMVQADMALYEAKALGRDRLSMAGSLHAASVASARALAGAAAQMRAAVGPAQTQSLSSTG